MDKPNRRTGARAMKTKSLYFSNRKEYYRRKKISEGLKRYYESKKYEEFKKRNKKRLERKKEVLYFVNFKIKNTMGYVRGYLASNHKLDFKEAVEIIKRNCKKGYEPISFEEAEEETNEKQKQTELIIFREEDEIFSRIIQNV